MVAEDISVSAIFAVRYGMHDIAVLVFFLQDISCKTCLYQHCFLKNMRVSLLVLFRQYCISCYKLACLPPSICFTISLIFT